MQALYYKYTIFMPNTHLFYFLFIRSGLPLGIIADLDIILEFRQWKRPARQQSGARYCEDTKMEVILLNDLYKTGVAGEIVKVADGFARNYLIPRKMAKRATESALRETEAVRKNVEARRAQYDNMLNDLAKQIDGVELIFGRRAASTGKLFGSVTTQEIADSLMEKTEVDLNRRRISQQSVREVGTHKVTVRLGNEISPVLIITVVPELELTEFLAARERGVEIKPEDLLDENFSYPDAAVEAVSEDVEEEQELETETIEEVVDATTEMEATTDESDESDE